MQKMSLFVVLGALIAAAFPPTLGGQALDSQSQNIWPEGSRPTVSPLF